ncbi:MAG TPA: hypothetical protein VK642_02485 [Burkholderiales bacterium]|nr:hypothetical protein [Burkholderiales bacterium]
MFRTGYAIARNFTLPLILSKKNVDGKCSTGIGTCVVLNDEGWIVTAGHMLSQYTEMMKSAIKVRDHEVQRTAIDNDKSIDHKERRNRLVKLGKLKPNETARCSITTGLPASAKISRMISIPVVDLGLAKIDGFDPKWISQYPVFKDPEKAFEPGVSLCKLGFPFQSAGVPTYDSNKDTFLLPPETFPAPLFPIEGIFTRTAAISVPPDQQQPPCPYLWVETSTPGLRGQSGGPTFDQKGTIWAIQCQTSHYPLGFDSTIPAQYFHVGLGVHPSTMFYFFNKYSIKYTVSDY